MAFKSKYTGAEIEERITRIDSIPELLSEMLTSKDFVTNEDLKCILKNYASLDYHDIPIDGITIYWDNNVLKARGSSNSNSGGGSSDDCLWEIRENKNGEKFLYSSIPVVTKFGITTYSDDNIEDVTSDLWEGIPIDNTTIYWDVDEEGNRVLKAKGGNGGGDSNIDLSDYATKKWVTDNYVSKTYLIEELKNYVDKYSDLDIEGNKNFINGIKINGVDIYKRNDGIIYIDSDVVIKGGLTTYFDDSIDISNSIMDSIIVDNISLKVIDGVLTFIGSSGGGEGLTEVTWNDIKEKPEFSKVATTGKYSDLDNTPESLKNPYPLTIGGKTYDGSSNVYIEGKDLELIQIVDSLPSNPSPDTLYIMI